MESFENNVHDMFAFIVSNGHYNGKTLRLERKKNFTSSRIPERLCSEFEKLKFSLAKLFGIAFLITSGLCGL